MLDCLQDTKSVVTNDSPTLCKIYTPFPLALGIATALGDAPESIWLEPSHGQGAFLRALSELGIAPNRIRAIDLDRMPSSDDALARTSRGIDFLEWSLETTERFDRVVGNPPYVAISQLAPVLRKTAACIADFEGLPIGSCSNTWYAFVLCAIRLLRDGGNLGFILPSAVEYAEYSGSLRAGIRKQFQSLELFRCRKPLFENVQEGTVVVLARGYKRGPFRFGRREFRTPKKLIASLSASSPDKMRECPPTRAAVNRETVVFHEIADVRLGGVTGDSDYFLLTERERQKHELPTQACTPVVSRARHLVAPVLSKKNWNALKLADERVWLFNPDKETLAKSGVRRYLERTSEDGGCDRTAYKIRNRVPWHSTPLPSEPHGFVSGMSRHGPWICLNGYAELNATNTLYVVKFRSTLTENERFGYALALLSSPVQRQLRKSARRYADGLIKYEPSSLTNLLVPNIQAKRAYRRTYCKAVRSLLSGQRLAARSIADRALGIMTSQS
jgi:adenine-specific DNA-methyltransferase